MTLNYIATSTFGLEAIVKREVQKLGGENIKVSDGRIDFTADINDIPKFNMWLRCADRLLINFGEFYAYSFEELFEKTKALPWGDWIGETDQFIVTGKSVKSQLYSISDCQSIVKKAIVEKLKQKYKVEWFEETGAEYKIQVGILRDLVTLTIDTTGPGLHKRGYRMDSMEAPIKETLASALIDLSYWKKDRILLEPTCGSGTIAIEAALIGRNIAPGLSRDFVSMEWPHIDPKIWQEEKAKAYSVIDIDSKLQIYASDIDPKAIDLAIRNAKIAGVDDSIIFEEKPLSKVKAPGEYGVLLSNPPYGGRIGEFSEIKELHKEFGNFYRKNPTWSMYVITTNEEFEKEMGRKADKKRKLFNGNVKTDYYQFFGPRPPRADIDKQ